jgi:hypothetical protein
MPGHGDESKVVSPARRNGPQKPITPAITRTSDKNEPLKPIARINETREERAPTARGVSRNLQHGLGGRDDTRLL